MTNAVSDELAMKIVNGGFLHWRDFHDYSWEYNSLGMSFHNSFSLNFDLNKLYYSQIYYSIQNIINLLCTCALGSGYAIQI